ncbi:MAG: non-homologous end joining protein Ku [Acidimicrobiales bacterium]
MPRTIAPRAIWSGSIGFGLVSIPVKLVPGVRKQDIHFHMLHGRDGSRIRQRRVCAAEGEEVPGDEIVKGYEVSPGHYVVVDPDELAELAPEATHSIDIEDFVSLEDIDPVYYDSTYYLLPDKAGAKAYRLLRETMAAEDRVGIARVVLRTKQYLCAVRPQEQALVLSTMNFADEVISPAEMVRGIISGPQPAERELGMARQLVAALATKFDPDRYHDTYRESLLELIERKAGGEELVASAVEPRPAAVVDLMAALEASLKGAESRKLPAADRGAA